MGQPTNGVAIEQEPNRRFPKPDDPEVLEGNETFREIVAMSQPESIADSVSSTVQRAWEALSDLSMVGRVWPVGAVENALAELPPEQAELLQKQLAFAAGVSEEITKTRETGDHIYHQAYGLVQETGQQTR